MTVSGRSDFLEYLNFPEVYHGAAISKALISGARRAVTGRGVTQHIEEIAAGGVAHIVFVGHSAPVGRKKIRNYLFSDLSGKSENYV